jgi:hypothetical protein
MTSSPLLNLTPKDEFWQEGVAIEATPVFLGSLDQLEHHGEGRLVRFSVAEAVTARGRSAADLPPFVLPRIRVQHLL